MESEEYKQKIIENSERNRETIKDAYKKGNEGLTEEGSEKETPEEKSLRNKILENAERIREELKKAYNKEQK